MYPPPTAPSLPLLPALRPAPTDKNTDKKGKAIAMAMKATMLPVVLAMLVLGGATADSATASDQELQDLIKQSMPANSAQLSDESSQVASQLLEISQSTDTRNRMLREGFADMVPSDKEIGTLKTMMERSSPVSSFATEMMTTGGLRGMARMMKGVVNQRTCVARMITIGGLTNASRIRP